MIVDQPNNSYVNYGIIGDGVTISAAGVLFTNADSGRISGGVTFAAGGSTFTNQLGGIVGVGAGDQAAIMISGSDGDDRVVNEGLIRGSIALGLGNDLYVDRDGQHFGSIEFGAGDDSYRLEGSGQRSPWANGGEGWDRFVMANTNYQVWGDNLVGFEELILERGGNLENFSGFQSITLASTEPYRAFYFSNSQNPSANIALAGDTVSLRNSSIASIIGGALNDAVELGAGATVGGDIKLGGGDDWVLLSTLDTSAGYSVAGVIEGGDFGRDTIEIHNWFGSSGTYDLGQMSGFEALWANSSYVQDFTMRVSNVRDVTDIRVGRGSLLILTASDLPSANLSGSLGGRVVLDADVTIARYGAPLEGPWDQRVDLPQADDSNSASLVNRGTILGEVRFYTGDDLYDGRSGFVGGTVYGNGGNDTLLGGYGAERFEGGFGGDTLSGGNGLDILVGGGGRDVFQDTLAGISGDVISDFEFGDRIVITNANIAGFAFQLTGNVLSFTGGSLTLTAPVDGRIVASSAAEGGVQFTIERDVRNDFNGDGRSDVLLRYSNGTITDWLGNSNGGFTDNWSNLALSLPTSWQVAVTGDFNGDGRDDMLLRHTSGTITDWLGNSNGTFSDNWSNFNAPLPTSWSIAGVGDFNNDQRDDLLLRHSSGTVTTWLGKTGGGFSDNWSNFSVPLPPSWSVAGVGDFNGDGRDDMLLRYTGGTVTTWLGNASGGFTDNWSNFNVPLPTAWSVVGVGDFNGDGRDDMLLRNASGYLTDWLGTPNGGFSDNWSNFNRSLSTSWTVESVGDFNRDGGDDILLRHTSGTLTNWLGTSTGSFLDNWGTFNTPLPTQWDVERGDYLLS